MNLVLVDYHKGNIRSVERALMNVGVDVLTTDDVHDIGNADAIVLPGVGAFKDAAQTLEELGLMGAIRSKIVDGYPFLGICLGLHLMFEGGEEHALDGIPTPGLGVIPGIVRKMPRTDAEGVPYKIPHVGWNRVEFDDHSREATIFDKTEPGEFMYFTHSYIAPESKCTIAETTHSVTFPCAVRYSNAFGVQFHPEKSSDAGLKMLGSFVDFAKGCQ